MKKISIIVPCYNEEESIPFFYEEITKVAETLKEKLEIIFVNDGSKDKTLDIAKEYSEKDKRIKYINFSRNFGKEAAMLAGLTYSTGDYVAIMDADLQDPPALLPKMIDILEDPNNDYDSVGTRRVTRKGEPPIRSFFARRFYKLINRISKVEMVDGARDFRLMKRQVVNSILELKEYNRYSKGLFEFVGYNTKWLEFENIERVAGETKWSFSKLFVYAIEGIVAFSTAPLLIPLITGIILCLTSLIVLIISAIYHAINSTYIITCVLSFVGGIMLMSMGILCEYLSKTYLEIKKRPIFIVKETNLENNNEKI